MLAVPDDHAIGRESLDRSDHVRAEQTLKTRQLTLTFQHKPHDRAFDRWLSATHGPDRSPWPVPCGAETKLMHYLPTLDNLCYVNSMARLRSPPSLVRSRVHEGLRM